MLKAIVSELNEATLLLARLCFKGLFAQLGHLLFHLLKEETVFIYLEGRLIQNDGRYGAAIRFPFPFS